MKKKAMKFLNLLVILSTGMVGCEKEQLKETGPEHESGPGKNTSSSNAIEFKQELLATIQKNGHEFKFIALEGDETVILERMDPAITNDTRGILSAFPGSTAFDIFVLLTDPHVAVPARIAATAGASELAASNREIDPANTAVEILSPEFRMASRSRACYDVGASTFRSTYCDAPVSSTATNIEFCDENTWTSHTRNSVYGGSWELLENAETWTNTICGVTRIQFYRFVSAAWELYYQVDVDNGIWHYVITSSTKRYRKVTRTQMVTGSFRAYTRFYN